MSVSSPGKPGEETLMVGYQAASLNCSAASRA